MKIKQVMTAALAAAALVVGLAGCTTSATPTSMCAFIVGDGQGGNDANVHQVAYPGQNVNVGNGESAVYVPCNSRNYVVNDGSATDAQGNRVGDRFTPVIGYTSSGTRIEVYVTAFWTLNQDEDAMNEFYAFCHKYTCAAPASESGSANYASPGWNGMLAENFSPTIDALVLEYTSEFDDTIWSGHDVDQYAALADQLSNNFNEAMRPRTGVEEDFFCGSGNSGWSDPDNPGEGSFECTNVRFEVTAVEAADAGIANLAEELTQAELETQVNQQAYEAAQARYGDEAGYWLGVQDAIAACGESEVACVINVGEGNASPAVDVSTPE